MALIILLEHLSFMSFLVFGIYVYSLYRGSWEELLIQQKLCKAHCLRALEWLWGGRTVDGLESD